MYFEEVESLGCRFIWRNRGWTGGAMGVRALLTAPSGQLEVVPARDTLSAFSGWSLVIFPSFCRIHLSISFWADRRLAPSSPAGGSQSIISCSSETLQKTLKTWAAKSYWDVHIECLITIHSSCWYYTCSTSLNVWCCWSGTTWTWTLEELG